VLLDLPQTAKVAVLCNMGEASKQQLKNEKMLTISSNKGNAN
jgi:hypothetical protein